jgi:hypothetical protein
VISFTLRLFVPRNEPRYLLDKWFLPPTAALDIVALKCFIRKEEAHEENSNSSYSFLTSALDGGEWSASIPGHAMLLGKDNRYPLYRKLDGLQTGMDTEPRGKILCFSWHRSPVVQSAVRHCTDRAIPAPSVFSNRLFWSKQGLWRLRILRGIQSLVAMSPNVRLLEALHL